MNIADELRKYAQSWRETPSLMYDLDAGDIDGLLGDIEDIADCIDAEHEARVSYWQGASYKDGYDEGFASADDWLSQHEDAMAEHGWVKLPVDGEAPCKQLSEWIERRGLIIGPLDLDGELWHKGDMSASPWGEIEGILFENGKWFISGHDTSAPWLPADSLLHYRAPTVEDVLREFWSDVDLAVADSVDPSSIIAEYAAKLRLADDREGQ